MDLNVIWSRKIGLIKISLLNWSYFLTLDYCVNNSLQGRMKVVRLKEVDSGMLWNNNFTWFLDRELARFRFLSSNSRAFDNILKQSGGIYENLYSLSEIDVYSHHSDQINVKTCFHKFDQEVFYKITWISVVMLL